MAALFIKISVHNITGWGRGYFWILAIPAAAALALELFLCSESPQWLFKQVKIAEVELERLLGGSYVKTSMAELHKLELDRGDGPYAVSLSKLLKFIYTTDTGIAFGVVGENRVVRKRKKRNFTKAKGFKYKCGKVDSKTLQTQKILQRTEVMFEVERDTREKMSNTCLLTQLRWLLRVTQRKKKRRRHKHYEESQERIRNRLLVMEREKYNWKKWVELGQGIHQGNREKFVVMDAKDRRLCDTIEMVVLSNGSSMISAVTADLRNVKVKSSLNPNYGEGNNLLVTVDEKARLKIMLADVSGAVSGNKESNEIEQPLPSDFQWVNAYHNVAAS